MIFAVEQKGEPMSDLIDRKAGRMNQKHCRCCPHLDFNAMTDEMYCKLKDFELIRLRWHKQRPDWCPLVMRRKGEKNERID